MLTETAKGRITDADFAAETAILVKNQILQQAAMQALIWLTSHAKAY